MIPLVDYGAGNLRSIQNTLDELGAEYGAATVGSAHGPAGHQSVTKPLRGKLQRTPLEQGCAPGLLWGKLQLARSFSSAGTKLLKGNGGSDELARTFSSAVPVFQRGGEPRKVFTTPEGLESAPRIFEDERAAAIVEAVKEIEPAIDRILSGGAE